MGDLLITNKDVTKKYLIRQLDNFVIDKKTGVTAMPLPEDEGNTCIVMKLVGAEIGMNIEWTMAEGEVSDLSGQSGVKTVWEQIDQFFFNWITSGVFLNSIKIFYGKDATHTGEGFNHNDYAWSKTAQVETGNISFEGGLVTAKASLKLVIGMVG